MNEGKSVSRSTHFKNCEMYEVKKLANSMSFFSIITSIVLSTPVVHYFLRP